MIKKVKNKKMENSKKTKKNNLNKDVELYELSWEVCNKVGGIYSVITSKAALIKEQYPSYTFIGPYIQDKAQEDFSELEVPEKYKDAFNELEQEKIKAHYGRWLIKGEPDVILLEFEGLKDRKNDLKKEFWETHRVDSINSQWEFEEPMLLSCASASLLNKLEQKQKINPEKTILQVHEWMTGFSILKLKNLNSKIKTVFTTHATMLGRTIAGNNQDLYGLLGHFDPEQKARELGVIDKHTAEKASANNATIFTTVSEITGREAEYILGRKPEILVLNGLDIGKFPSIEETSIKHVTVREQIREFLAYAFFPYYKFELKHNLSFFLASRYEFENKGIDIYIDALKMLNEELKKNKTERTISAFFFIAVPNNGVKMDLLENKNYYRHIKNYVGTKSSEIMNKIINDFMSNGQISDTVFDKEFLQEMHKDVLRFKRKGEPIICTHKLNVPENQDRIINAIRAAGLNNSKEDKVKVILFPAYLNGNDTLFNTEFYDLIAGCHLGVFPSYYEPWGYTPLEAAALGVPSITSDLTGFGRFIEQQTVNKDTPGIYILKRDKISKEESTKELYSLMKNFVFMSHEDRVENKIQAKELAKLADWKILVKNYIEAYEQALNK